jgi:hypothetical protein
MCMNKQSYRIEKNHSRMYCICIRFMVKRASWTSRRLIMTWDYKVSNLIRTHISIIVSSHYIAYNTLHIIRNILLCTACIIHIALDCITCTWNVLYGCETWSVILKEEHRLRVFQNRVLRRIFGSMRDEVTGGWRKLHNEELHNLYSSQSIIRMIKSRRMSWAGHSARMMRNRSI